MVPCVVDPDTFSSRYIEQTSRKYPKGLRVRRHIPHAERPREFVSKRNQRERRRVGKVNAAFEDLRDRVPFIKDDDKTSKVAVLKSAAQYIHFLSSLLLEDESSASDVCHRMHPVPKQNDSTGFDKTEQCWSMEEQQENDMLYRMGIVPSCRFEHHREYDQSKATEQSLLWESHRPLHEANSHFSITQTLF
ncbi:achaete-scute homolog 1a-like [Gigantopelta aegis]|uniref:achaete-scute homolog 1a-like n=1 Tax=Gigantopelta aegis TaxID=1735272 RepID=UPI001B8894C7|nr:achaete-scute homolog 1a-like [Gigantopelta aegis]